MDLEQLVSDKIYQWIFKSKEFGDYKKRNQIYHKFDIKYFKKHKEDYLNYHRINKIDYYYNYLKTFKRYIGYIKAKKEEN